MNTDDLALLFAAGGFLLLVYRMWPRAAEVVPAPLTRMPLVSIIVPARNEEAVLGRLLTSLQSIDYPAYEVIVVDDCSTDQTAAIATSFPGVRLIRGAERPPGWNGKQWACEQGGRAALGSYLLFTDADTEHKPGSLKALMASFQRTGAQGMTGLPEHQCPDLWEKLCGPFHVMLLAATHPYGKGRIGQVYAIGQYLCFERAMYEKMGGHGRVRDSWVEDIPLAHALLKDGGRWHVYRGAPLFSVRMYASCGEFIKGWRRNFRAGMSYSYGGSGLEMTAFIAALIGAGQWLRMEAWVIIVLTLLVMVPMQASLGKFSRWGLVLFPFSLGLFCYVSMLAVYDLVLKKPMVWKNRAYNPT